jgi:heat shock protein HtpX
MTDTSWAHRSPTRPGVGAGRLVTAVKADRSSSSCATTARTLVLMESFVAGRSPGSFAGMIESVDDKCPECDAGLVRRARQPVWCGGCEWNLGAYEPDKKAPRVDRWVAGFSHRAGYRLDAAFFSENVGKPLEPPGLTAARVGLLAVSLGILVLVVGCLGLGLWWVVDGFPSWSLVPGAFLVFVAFALLPRFGRVARWGALTPKEAPQLHALVNEVCEAVGCPRPDAVVVDSGFNASAGIVGWRRRRVLRIGLALWGSLAPAERVALLGHEMGHFVNNDPLRGLLTQPALTVFGALADAVRPHPDMASPGNGLDQDLLKLALLVVSPVLWAASSLLAAVQLGLRSIASRDSQRAEYSADVLAAEVAGTNGLVGLLNTLVLGDSVVTAIRGVELSPRPGAALWLGAAARAKQNADITVARQLSVRESASLWSSHPPAGYRARMIEALPVQDAKVVLSDERLAAIDVEVADWYKRAGRDITA